MGFIPVLYRLTHEQITEIVFFKSLFVSIFNLFMR